jgi:hypothetical protein
MAKAMYMFELHVPHVLYQTQLAPACFLCKLWRAALQVMLWMYSGLQAAAWCHHSVDVAATPGLHILATGLIVCPTWTG